MTSRSSLAVTHASGSRGSAVPAKPVVQVDSPAEIQETATQETVPQRTAIQATAIQATAPRADASPGSPDHLDELAEHSRQLENATPRQIIQWAVDHYHPSLGMATAFGPEGCVILHYLAEIEPSTYVFNLETGYQFAETLELRDRIAKRYGIEVAMLEPDLSVAEYEKQNGGPLYKTDPGRCCQDRKIKTLHRAAENLSAWMSGIRRDQSDDRAGASIVGWDKRFSLVKVSPLANWTKQDVWKLITDEDVPYNSLHDQGYTSIGCWPCTRATLFGEDERAGRWSGTAKTECGLHTLE